MDLAEKAQNELWEVSQQTGALGSMTSSPCYPSKSTWWGWTAILRPWALQTWIEIAKWGTGTNAMIADSAKPREHDRHILDCCPADREQEVFKWFNRTGVRWLSQLRDEAGTHLRTETLSRLTSNTSVPHSADDTEAARVLVCIHTQRGYPNKPQYTRGQAQKAPWSWTELGHHRGYAGSFVEFTEPEKEPRLIEVSSVQDRGGLGRFVLHGWGIPANLAPRRAHERPDRGRGGGGGTRSP